VKRPGKKPATTAPGGKALHDCCSGDEGSKLEAHADVAATAPGPVVEVVLEAAAVGGGVDELEDDEVCLMSTQELPP
jgi:hypothetical protein